MIRAGILYIVGIGQCYSPLGCTHTVLHSGLDTDTICVSLGSADNPSDSILSIRAKRTEGGWEAESKRAVGGGWEGIRRKGRAGMLAGDEERSCWQVDEEENGI